MIINRKEETGETGKGKRRKTISNGGRGRAEEHAFCTSRRAPFAV